MLDGTITTETLELWRQDYSILTAERLSNMWTKAIEAGPKGQPILDGLAFEFNTQTPGILDWLKERGANFVTVCTQEQQDAIAALLAKKMREGHTVDELARLIRPCIGLTEGQAKANARYYDSIVANLRKEHPRMKIESIRKKARDAALKYAERQHRERAFTIAQTESAFAYNWGADEGIRQAQAEGYLGIVKKRWSTSGDDGVCDLCNSLEGTEVSMDEDFNIGGKLLFRGQHMLPPAHPRCACAVEYIEVSAPKIDVLSGMQEILQHPEADEIKEEGDVTEFARETTSRVKTDFYEKFGIQSNVDTVRMKTSDFEGLLDGTLAYVNPNNPNVLHLNPSIFKDEETFYNTLGRRIKAYHRNASPSSIVCHEMAHNIENNVDSVKIVNDVAAEYIKEHPKSAMDAFLADYQIAGETISRYAITTEHEFWAESFADMFANGDNASEVSQKLVSEARKALGVTKKGKIKMRKFSELIEKSNLDNVIKGRFKIMKSDDEKMLAFGWANVSMRVDGELIEDWQGDIIEPEELEAAAYEYVRLYGDGGEMHERGGVAVLIESIVFTEEKMQVMGIPAGTLPVGWWIGFKVTDKDVWEKVRNGTYPMFSIEGEAERV